MYVQGDVMSMIRQATASDAPTLAPLLYDAIHEIAYTLTGTSTRSEALERLIHWIQQPDNRLSFQNTWVYCVEDQPVGMMIFYRGLDANELDKPLQIHLIQQGLPAAFDQETEGDVLYIDTVSVHPDFGGRGIGTRLFHHAEELARKQKIQSMTLNVDQDNPSARRLYERLGFQEQRIRMISGALFSYMAKAIN